MKKILFALMLVLIASVSWAADAKVSALDADTAPTSDDLIMTVDAPGTVPVNKKVTLGNLYKAWKGYLDIPAGSMIPDTSSGLLQKDSTNIVDYLAFSGTAAEQAAMFSFSLEDWDLSTVKAKFVWGPSSEDNAQGATWCLTCYAVSDGDTYDVALTAGPQCAHSHLEADTWSALKQEITPATAALTVQGTPAAGDVVYCKVYRDIDDASDDYEHDAWLFRVKIEYGKATPTAW